MSLNEEQIAEAFSQLTITRHSCRAFLDTPLDGGQIDRLLTLAQRAPSDCNTQAWRTYILSGGGLDELRGQLYAHVISGGERSYDLAPIAQYEGVFLNRRRECGWALYNAVGVQKGDRDGSRMQALENFRFFGAPHIAVLTSETSLGERGVLDLGIYLGFFLLAAESLHIAAVPQAAISFHAELVRRALCIPKEHRIACIVSFGKEDINHAANAFRTSRAPLSECVVKDA